MGFYVWWAISAGVLLLLAAWAGRNGVFPSLGQKRTSLGILIDERERYSLNRLQIIMWTILVLSTFLGLLLSHLSNPSIALEIPNNILGLIGLSAATTTVAGAVKDGKNATRQENILGGANFGSALRAKSSAMSAPPAGGGTAPGSGGRAAFAPLPSGGPRLVQMVLEEEGVGALLQIVSATKFQHFIFTLGLGAIYIVLTVQKGSYPQLDQNVLWLIGVSQAGYVGGKVPDKP